jgi:Putative beta-barrel porin 2
MAATGAGLSLAPAGAEAQILDPPGRTVTRPVRPKPPSEAPDPLLAPDDQTPADTGFAPDFGTTTVTPADAQDGIDPQDASAGEAETREAQDAATPGAEEAGDTDEFGEARTRPRQLPPQDGDLPTVIEEAAPANEGIVDLNAPSGLPNELDATLADMRNPRDLTLFAGIAPGFDPLLLEAQETNPVFSDIANFDPDPFVPLGTRIGSFLLFLALESDGDYNSNVFASPEAFGDYALEVRPSVRLASNWGTHALELRASGDLSFHDKFTTEDDRAYLVD